MLAIDAEDSSDEPEGLISHISHSTIGKITKHHQYQPILCSWKHLFAGNILILMFTFACKALIYTQKISLCRELMSASACKKLFNLDQYDSKMQRLSLIFTVLTLLELWRCCRDTGWHSLMSHLRLIYMSPSSAPVSAAHISCNHINLSLSHTPGPCHAQSYNHSHIITI